MVVSTDVIRSINPADESVIEEIPVTGAERVEEIIDRAHEAQPEWAARPLNERISLMQQAADNIDNRAEDLARDMTREQGKPLTESRAEVTNSADRIRYFCEQVEAVLEEEEIPVNPDVTGRVQKRPLGVVAGIKPWNFPMNIPIWTVVPALLTGNTYILKPSELTPVIGRKLIECFPEELHVSNVLNLVQGGGEVGRLLVENDRIDYVAFVGSRETGEWIYRASASHLRDFSLELGGKDPMIVLDDADPERALEGALFGAFKNCGQVCCGIERLLVPSSMEEEFTERLIEGVRNLRVGDGLEEDTDVGPMIRETERERVKNHLRDAEENGARIHYCKNTPDTDRGFWQAPALITNVTTEMTVMNEETFGPVLPVLPYDDEEQAIREANRLEYGLSAMIYGEDPVRLKNVADRVQAGSIGLNQTVGSIVDLPWGGVKQSGVGRMLGRRGIEKFTETTALRWNPDELNNYKEHSGHR